MKSPGCLIPILAPLGLSVVFACSSQTGGGRLQFAAQVSGASLSSSESTSTSSAFVNDLGWRIELTKATLTLGPIYLSSTDRLTGGRIVGEVLDQLEVDTLSPKPQNFRRAGDGTEDLVRSTNIAFYPPAGLSPSAQKATTPTLEVRGSASARGSTIAFHGVLTLDDAWLVGTPGGIAGSGSLLELRQARAIPSIMLPQPGGHLEVRIDPRSLFLGADFSSPTLGPAGPDGVIELQSASASYPPDAIMRTLFNQLRASEGTFDVRWRP